MEKYKVKVSHLFSELVDVEAADQNEAKEKVLELLKSSERQSNAIYETTISPEHWAVITEEKYQQMLKDVENELAKQQEGNKEPSNIITPDNIKP